MLSLSLMPPPHRPEARRNMSSALEPNFGQFSRSCDSFDGFVVGKVEFGWEGRTAYKEYINKGERLLDHLLYSPSNSTMLAKPSFSLERFFYHYRNSGLIFSSSHKYSSESAIGKHYRSAHKGLRFEKRHTGATSGGQRERVQCWLDAIIAFGSRSCSHRSPW